MNLAVLILHLPMKYGAKKSKNRREIILRVRKLGSEIAEVQIDPNIGLSR